MKERFKEPIKIAGHHFTAEQVINALKPEMAKDRFEKLSQVASQRILNHSFVLDSIYDEGNISAVMRTCENFGIVDLNIIESRESKISTRTTKGAQKWLEVSRFSQAKKCIDSLKQQGKTIVVTSFSEKAISLNELNLDQELAFVFGNEKSGVSQEFLNHADIECHIPTVGFSQSLNIGIAVGIFSHYISTNNEKKLERPKIINNILASYLLRGHKAYHTSPLSLAEKINTNI